MPEVVHVPDAHNSIVGTANIRQDLVPIIDLAFWLGMRGRLTDDLGGEEGLQNSDRKVIVTYFNHMSNGFLVDEVVRIHRITWNDIKDYSAITDFNMVESVLGVININERMIQLLDFENIVAEINPNSKLHDVTIDMSLADQRSNFTVYLAEDSAVMRRILVQNFSQAGYKVVAHDNGRRLLDSVNKKKPDLIITDMEMPIASGDYVVREVRQVYSKADLPILVFSSMASDANERKLVGLGADKFIGKPEMALLVRLVDEFLILNKKKK
jgi:two-component system chemotaxis response regulator CheV